MAVDGSWDRGPLLITTALPNKLVPGVPCSVPYIYPIHLQKCVSLAEPHLQAVPGQGPLAPKEKCQSATSNEV